MLKDLVLIFIATVTYSSLVGQNLGNCQIDSIPWKPSEKLKWSDFQGKPKRDSKDGMLAACAPSINIKGFRDDLPNFGVTNHFLKKVAWTTDTSSIELLNHEQCHFDIAEVCARRIRAAVDSLRSRKVSDIIVYTSVIDALLEQYDMEDVQYDSETSHGAIDLEQQKWEKRVAQELKKLNKWAIGN